MTLSDARELSPGLYQIYWKSGGHSLAAVGMTASGDRWLAPTNWIEPARDGKAWRMVSHVSPLIRTGKA